MKMSEARKNFEAEIDRLLLELPEANRSQVRTFYVDVLAPLVISHAKNSWRTGVEQAIELVDVIVRSGGSASDCARYLRQFSVEGLRGMSE